MKILCAMLVVLLFVHLQCVAFCLMDQIAQQTEPPCHHHSGQAQPDHDASSVCTAGPSLASNVLIQFAVAPLPIAGARPILAPVLLPLVAVSPPLDLSSIHLISTLRI